MAKYQISEQQERFQFEVERWVLKRQVEGITVAPDGVILHLSDNGFISFKADGPNIMIGLPDTPPCHTLDIETGGTVQ